jgi:hypothetical protein
VVGVTHEDASVRKLYREQTMAQAVTAIRV